jgi:hypothetical protein
MGRSVFRTYDEGRLLPFANVYSGQLFSLDAERRVHRCDARFEGCASFDVGESGLFRAGARAIAPVSSEYERLRSLAEETGPGGSDEGRSHALLPSGTVTLSGSRRHMLAWAPDVRVAAGQSLRVFVDVTAHVDPGHRVELVHALGIDRSLRPFELPPLADGDRVQITYRFAPEAGRPEVGIALSAHPSATAASLEVHEASWAVMPRAEGEQGNLHGLVMRPGAGLGARLRARPDAPDHPRLVAQASGASRGVAHTLETLGASHARGLRLVELDLAQNDDDALMLAHGSNLSLQEAVVWASGADGVSLVLDLRSLDPLPALTRIARAHPRHLERLVPQVYTPAQATRAGELGFARVMLSLERSHADDEAVVAFADDRPPWAVTMGAERARRAGLADRLRELGVPVYVQSVDRPAQVASLRQVGVHGVFTGELTPRPAAAP